MSVHELRRLVSSDHYLISNHLYNLMNIRTVLIHIIHSIRDYCYAMFVGGAMCYLGGDADVFGRCRNTNLVRKPLVAMHIIRSNTCCNRKFIKSYFNSVSQAVCQLHTKLVRNSCCLALAICARAQATPIEFLPKNHFVSYVVPDSLSGISWNVGLPVPSSLASIHRNSWELQRWLWVSQSPKHHFVRHTIIAHWPRFPHAFVSAVPCAHFVLLIHQYLLHFWQFPLSIWNWLPLPLCTSHLVALFISDSMRIIRPVGPDDSVSKLVI